MTINAEIKTDSHDERHLARAIELALGGLYTARPNPCVGCVIVREGEVVGEGWHRRAGEEHAEVNALAQAGAKARGATAYVSLEPCCHHGRTGPCTEALRAAGVERVVSALADPNPEVAGGGIAALEAAGIDACLIAPASPLARRAASVVQGFARRIRGGRPWVRVKMAQSLDARTAMASGESQWITGPQARRDGHRLRARSGAIVTGVGTVLKDDPSLTVRLVDASDVLPAGHRSGPDDDDGISLPEIDQPLRVVLDSRARTPAHAKVLDGPGRVLVVTASERAASALRSRNNHIDTQDMRGDDGLVDLERVLARLAALDVNEVLVEAGATIAGAFLKARLVDELVLYMAPIMLGDAAWPLARLSGLDAMQDKLEFEFESVERIGADLKVVARPV